MTTFAGTQKDLGQMLNSLIELDYDAVAAYEVAVDKMQTQAYKERMREFMGDHQRHIIDLKPHAAHLGVNVASGPDMKQYLTTGKVVLAQLAGDRAILYAMQSNEDDTNTAYERAICHEDASPDLLSVLQRGFNDERRHRSWINRCLNPEQPQHEYSENISPEHVPLEQFTETSLRPNA
ncbi:MAG: DUF2383 domain-containing protein [Cytophagaceae bacterium]|nr:MAG: DUF2383 domain-containing protein [Cytophagaceae bacterium]